QVPSSVYSRNRPVRMVVRTYPGWTRCWLISGQRSTRDHGDSTDEVFLYFTLGARSCVSPPLSDSFIGSPLFLTHIQTSGAAACSSSVGRTASQIRQMMLLFTPEAMGTMLHDAAHEVSP